MFCSNCGKELEAGDLFCGYCGGDRRTVGAESCHLVLVEGGSFQVEGQSVVVGSFLMGQYPITQEEWQSVMGINPSAWKGSHLPVESITWYEAVEFCNELSLQQGLAPCYTDNGEIISCDWSANGYRLPTELEWEYAARGGVHQSHYQYSGSDDIDEVAWHEGNSDGRTHAVGGKKPNALGLYDMSGNVREWCWNWYDDGYGGSSASINPPDATSCYSEGRYFRGGSWNDSASACTVTVRNNFLAYYAYPYVGLRVVRLCR